MLESLNRDGWSEQDTEGRPEEPSALRRGDPHDNLLNVSNQDDPEPLRKLAEAIKILEDRIVEIAAGQASAARSVHAAADGLPLHKIDEGGATAAGLHTTADELESFVRELATVSDVFRILRAEALGDAAAFCSRERRYVSSSRGNGEQPVALLDDLIERYGTDAILTVHAHMPGGEIVRWELMIDGGYVPTADVRISERGDHSVMLLTDAREEIELTRWREGARGTQRQPASFVERLGALQRRSCRGYGGASGVGGG